MDMATAGIRTVRAVVFTALCVTLSAGSHVLLSGAPLPLVPLFAVTAVIFLLAFALADRERGYGRIAAVLIPLELLADTVFTSGQHTCYGQAGGPVTGSLRSVGVDLLCGGGGFGAALAPSAHRGHGLARLGPLEAAPAATPFGEAALAGLLRAASATAFRPLRLAFTAGRRLLRTYESGLPEPLRPRPAAGPHTLLLTHSVHRRGPPLPVSAR